MKTIKSLTEVEIAEFPKLPEEWKWARLGEIHILKSDKHKGSGESLFYVGLEHIKKDQGTLTEDVKVDVINTVKNSFKIGDLLYGKLRPYLNKVYLANEDGVCSTDILVFESTPSLNLNYSKYFFLSYKFVNDMTHNSSGVNLPRVSTKYLQEYPFPLAPPPEQRAIVSKIELLFSELDNGIANLKLAQEQLKVYRQAVLKKAFEGELTKKWREQQTDLPDAGDLLEQIRREREEAAKAFNKNKKITSLLSNTELANLSILPTGWKWAKIDEILQPNRECAYGVLQPGDDLPEGILLVRVGDIFNGKVDTSGMKRISPEIANKYQRTFLEGGELLISLVGAIGRTAIAPIQIKGANVARAVGVVPISKILNPYYIEYFFRRAEKVHELTSQSHEVARKTLNLEDVKKATVTICSFPEQQAIVQEIETRLSVCDKIELDIEENLEKAEALRQSILKKAFEGKLLNERELAEVRGAEDWEPAEVLLERVRVEKADSGKKGRS
ncbi:restriction endonuclease subunit S [Methanosarcina sp. 2.H.A.1B.4]|uniref:restriction endonuclease subunit S n=1 Tax=Methanosarcina sp. 2.H.A.1B.4 TaxID=1483600 RepID=UPI000621BFF4|nr:restriction endonuclease subunit S [Methanosarcina sp. 2.H.A.1B.4]KKG08711.1 hypothetical protein EO92_12830 [Methanosarcina sp. 2.H.A.1B.4]